MVKSKTNATAKQVALLLHFHVLLFCFVFHFFLHNIVDGWPSVAAIGQHKHSPSPVDTLMHVHVNIKLETLTSRYVTGVICDSIGQGIAKP